MRASVHPPTTTTLTPITEKERFSLPSRPVSITWFKLVVIISYSVQYVSQTRDGIRYTVFFFCVRATRLLTVPYLSVIEDRPDVRRSWVRCPKSRFHSHLQAKPGEFETKIATCYRMCLIPTILQQNRGLWTMLRFNFNVCDNYKFLKRNLNLISTRNLRELRYRSIHDKRVHTGMLKLLI